MAEFEGKKDERAAEREGDLTAQKDDLGLYPMQAAEHAGHGAESQQLSRDEEASDESVRELAETDQALEAEAVDGVEDAANHPERPVHTHEEYGSTDDIPPLRRDDDAA